MTLRRLSLLQWLGLLLGASVWAGQHIVGYGLTEATCDSAGFQINHDLWQALIGLVAAALVIAAETAAVGVLLGTRDTSYEAEAPGGRLRFFAIAAVAANAIFLMIIVLDAIAAIFNTACTQA